MNFRFINIIMKDDLVELVMHLNCNCVVMSSNLGLNKITFYLLKPTLAWMWRDTETLGGLGRILDVWLSWKAHCSGLELV